MPILAKYLSSPIESRSNVQNTSEKPHPPRYGSRTHLGLVKAERSDRFFRSVERRNFCRGYLCFSSSFSLKGNSRAASRAAAASTQRVKVVTSHPQEDLAVPHTTLRLAHYSPTVCKKSILLRPE